MTSSTVIDLCDHMENGVQNSKYNKVQRIGALLGIIALAGLSVATLMAALFGGETGDELFFRLLITTISAPIAIWLLVWAFGALKNRQKGEAEPSQEKGDDGNG